MEREGERGSGRQKVCTVHSLSQRILHGTREQRKEMPDRDVCQLCPGGIEGERSLSTVRERGAHTTHSLHVVGLAGASQLANSWGSSESKFFT